MEQSPPKESGFIWVGAGSLNHRNPLEPVPWIVAVQERCTQLCFTGLLSLTTTNGEAIVFQEWFGGNKSPDHSSIIFAGDMWLIGAAYSGKKECTGFRAVQRLPAFDGLLTGVTASQGQIVQGTLLSIFKHCAKYLFCADLVLRNPSGEVIKIIFTRGKPDYAVVSGDAQPASQIWTLIEGWDAGRYEFRLHPLFGLADS